MHLGWSAVTMASHLAIVLSIILALVNAVHAVLAPGGLRVSPLLRWAICGVASALVVERCYYLVARLLVNTPIDLWSMHPVPEALALTVASSFLLCATAILSSRSGPARVHIAITEAAAVVFICTVVAVTAW